jgi:hypothetical protein
MHPLYLTEASETIVNCLQNKQFSRSARYGLAASACQQFSLSANLEDRTGR